MEPGPRRLGEHRKAIAEAIADIQGSIHANDSKSSAALIVHSVLVAGVLGLASRLGPIYEDGSDGTRGLIEWTLGGALAMFVLSVSCLLWAVKPWEPKRLTKRIERDHDRYHPVLFPDARAMGRAAKARGRSEPNQLLEAFGALDERQMDLQYVAELAKVAAIRRHEAVWARAGFLLLAVEVLFVTAFLVVVGLNAVDTF